MVYHLSLENTVASKKYGPDKVSVYFSFILPANSFSSSLEEVGHVFHQNASQSVYSLCDLQGSHPGKDFSLVTISCVLSAVLL